MTQFFIQDNRPSSQSLNRVTRTVYKHCARVTDRAGLPYRVATIYVDGIPTKTITLLPGDQS